MENDYRYADLATSYFIILGDAGVDATRVMMMSRPRLLTIENEWPCR
jgi:hypothetical protein